MAAGRTHAAPAADHAGATAAVKATAAAVYPEGKEECLGQYDPAHV